MSSKISVIMPSYLGDYPNAATNRVDKFHRAIYSFLTQSYDNKELIIVSDGCPITIIEASKYMNHDCIKLYGIDKQPLFSGKVRDYGLQKANGDIICYLDTDDYFGINHLYNIALGFFDNDWVFFDYDIVYIIHPINKTIISKAKKDVIIQHGSIGTSSIAHKRDFRISWGDCNGYGHDWNFINNLLMLNLKFKKISNCEYYVCHIPNSTDV
jgi:glycosyltransferase involved in cell wall biosynthesis